MGRASRRKAERITIGEAPFAKLQLAIAQRDLFQERANTEFKARMAEHNAKVVSAMKAAGLDPDQAYNLDEQTLTATLK